MSIMASYFVYLKNIYAKKVDELRKIFLIFFDRRKSLLNVIRRRRDEFSRPSDDNPGKDGGPEAYSCSCWAILERRSRLKIRLNPATGAIWSDIWLWPRRDFRC